MCLLRCFWSFYPHFFPEKIPDTLWTRKYGGAEMDFCSGAVETNDRGFFAAAVTTSFGQETETSG